MTWIYWFSWIWPITRAKILNFTLFKGKMSKFFSFFLYLGQNFLDSTYYPRGAHVYLVSTRSCPLTKGTLWLSWLVPMLSHFLRPPDDLTKFLRHPKKLPWLKIFRTITTCQMSVILHHILWCTSFPMTLIPVYFFVGLFGSDLQYIPHSYQTSLRVATDLEIRRKSREVKKGWNCQGKVRKFEKTKEESQRKLNGF